MLCGSCFLLMCLLIITWKSRASPTSFLLPYNIKRTTQETAHLELGALNHIVVPGFWGCVFLSCARFATSMERVSWSDKGTNCVFTQTRKTKWNKQLQLSFLELGVKAQIKEQNHERREACFVHLVWPVFHQCHLFHFSDDSCNNF